MVQTYTHLAKDLPRHIFKPYTARLFTMGFLLLLGISAMAAIVMLPLAWPVKLLLGAVIGHCWGVGGLIGHEILHGSVVRGKVLQDRLALISFAPFIISPTFWRFWHNKLHHTHTQRLILDPDAYPTYRVFQASKYMKWMYPFTPGSGFKRSYFYFFFWFSLNVLVAQFYLRFRNRTFESMDHKLVNRELAVQIAVAAGVLALVGPANWLWVVAVPLLVQNYIVFSYISTNHNLNPLTKHNDPLANTLTVTNHPLLERLHVNFGYHVEHHMFPSVNGVHVKEIHNLLKERYPEKYLHQPKWQAMKALYKTARIYKTPTVLMNPNSKETYSTIGHAEAEEVLHDFMMDGQLPAVTAAEVRA